MKRRKCSQRQWCVPGRRSTPVAAQPGKSYSVPGKQSPLLPEPVEGIGSSLPSDLNTDDENSDVDVTDIEEITEQISSPLDHPFSEGNGSFAQNSTTLSSQTSSTKVAVLNDEESQNSDEGNNTDQSQKFEEIIRDIKRKAAAPLSEVSSLSSESPLNTPKCSSDCNEEPTKR